MIGRLVALVVVLAAGSVAKVWSGVPPQPTGTIAAIGSLPTASEAGH